MTRTRWWEKTRCLTVALALAAAGAAQSQAPSQSQGTPQTGLPAEKSSHGIAYVSGGVGLEESAALKAAQASYSLTVEVFQSAGGKNEYTASVPLIITRGQGETVFEGATDGPYTLLRLPAGRYVVKASFNGQSLQRQVDVAGAGKAAKASFVFKGG